MSVVYIWTKKTGHELKIMNLSITAKPMRSQQQMCERRKRSSRIQMWIYSWLVIYQTHCTQQIFCNCPSISNCIRMGYFQQPTWGQFFHKRLTSKQKWTNDIRTFWFQIIPVGLFVSENANLAWNRTVKVAQFVNVTRKITFVRYYINCNTVVLVVTSVLENNTTTNQQRMRLLGSLTDFDSIHVYHNVPN